MSFIHLPFRLAEKIEIDSDTGCWLWRGYVQNGYGYYGKKRAHRLIWTLLIGELSQSEVLDHLKCENKICVNPEHMNKTNHADHNRRHKSGKKMMLSESERERRREHGRNMIVHAAPHAYSQRSRVEASTEAWSNRTPERRAEIGEKISASKRGDA